METYGPAVRFPFHVNSLSSDIVVFKIGLDIKIFLGDFLFFAPQCYVHMNRLTCYLIVFGTCELNAMELNEYFFIHQTKKWVFLMVHFSNFLFLSCFDCCNRVFLH